MDILEVIVIATMVATAFFAVKNLIKVIKPLKSEFQLRKTDGFSKENIRFIFIVGFIVFCELSLLALAGMEIDNQNLGVIAIGIGLMAISYNRKLSREIETNLDENVFKLF